MKTKIPENCLDIVNLIEKTPITRLNKTYESKFIQKIKNNFTETQQQLFVASFYCLLNYNSKTDFIIEFNSVWKWLGFSRKDHCKVVLDKHFTIDVDYIIKKEITNKIIENKDAPEVAGAKIIHTNLTGKIILPQVRENKKDETRGGSNKEIILLNINTFKKLCLKSNTTKADEIHDYYIKLEETFQQILNEESEELKLQLNQQKVLVKELENKPDTEGFNRKEGGTYLVKDNDKKGHYKIGVFEYDKNESNNKRLSQLNVGSSTRSLETIFVYKTFDKYFSEKIIHYALKPFRIKNEWFYFKDDLELAYAINTIKHCTNYIDRYNIVDYTSFKNSNKDLIIENELKELEKEIKLQPTNLKQEVLIKKQVYKKDLIHIKSEKYIGVFFLQEKNKWISKLNDIYLGIFDTELEAAKTYNDYALHINQSNKEFNYILNDIPDYTTTPRNVIDESYIHHNNISKYNGVSYNITRKYYQVGIKLNNKTYNLGNTPDEIEAAKIYNQQAAYFNESLDTKYILNDIPNYITIAKNIYKELQNATKANKTSNYYGVSYSKQKKKWISVYVINKKQKQIGSFTTELEAAKAYNKVIIELNNDGCTYKVNTFQE